MVPFIIFIIALSIFDVRNMWKKNLRKEMVVFFIIASITLSFGVLYFSNPLGFSFVKAVFDIINPNYSK